MEMREGSGRGRQDYEYEDGDKDKEAKLFAEHYLDFFVESEKQTGNNLIYYLSENASFDWFGKTIKGEKNIKCFLKEQLSSVEHDFSQFKPVSKIGFRESHFAPLLNLDLKTNQGQQKKARISTTATTNNSKRQLFAAAAAAVPVSSSSVSPSPAATSSSSNLTTADCIELCEKTPPPHNFVVQKKKSTKTRISSNNFHQFSPNLFVNSPPPPPLPTSSLSCCIVRGGEQETEEREQTQERGQGDGLHINHKQNQKQNQNQNQNQKNTTDISFSTSSSTSTSTSSCLFSPTKKIRLDLSECSLNKETNKRKKGGELKDCTSTNYFLMKQKNFNFANCDDENQIKFKIKYVRGEGFVKFHKRSMMKKLQKETNWSRPCSLEIAYTGDSPTNFTIHLVIYKGNVKCRRNLLKEFMEETQEQEEEEEETETQTQEDEQDKTRNERQDIELQ